MQTQMRLRLLFCATLLATADARLALSVDSHTTLVVTPERVYESAASLAIIDAADSAVSDIRRRSSGSGRRRRPRRAR